MVRGNMHGNLMAKGLDQGRIRLNSVADSLLWAHNKKDGNVSVALVYDLSVKSLSIMICDKVYGNIWSCQISLKI